MAREIDRAACDVRVDIHAPGEHNHPRSINRAPADDRRHKLAAINTQIPDLAVNAVGGVKNFSACDPNHGVPCLIVVKLIWQDFKALPPRSKAAMHVAWAFMSESFAKHAFTVVRLSMDNMLRFHSVSWPCDGPACPSYLQFLLSMFREVPNTISAE